MAEQNEFEHKPMPRYVAWSAGLLVLACLCWIGGVVIGIVFLAPSVFLFSLGVGGLLWGVSNIAVLIGRIEEKTRMLAKIVGQKARSFEEKFNESR